MPLLDLSLQRLKMLNFITRLHVLSSAPFSTRLPYIGGSVAAA
jgi:hypothetical protein